MVMVMRVATMRIVAVAVALVASAQQKRRPLQQENPDMPNADISRLSWASSGGIRAWRRSVRFGMGGRWSKRFTRPGRRLERVTKSGQSLLSLCAAAAATTKTGCAGKKLDQQQQQDFASFTRDESYPNQKFGEYIQI